MATPRGLEAGSAGSALGAEALGRQAQQAEASNGGGVWNPFPISALELGVQEGETLLSIPWAQRCSWPRATSENTRGQGAMPWEHRQ